MITNTIMMVKPACFGFNAETAENNAFQDSTGAENTEQIKQEAIREFDSMVSLLRSKGIEVIVMEDSENPVKPDAVFPNNWFSTHSTGEIITYPMHAVSRRVEREESYVQYIVDSYNYNHRIAFESFENRQVFLEGTGSLILDRAYKLAYACLSPRTHTLLLDEFCSKLGYTKVAFFSQDENGQAVYHTNVMMALGQQFAVICLDSIPDAVEREHVIASLAQSDKEIIEITLDQMNQFAGNMLQVLGAGKKPYLVMSQTAKESLREDQLQAIHKHTEILVPSIPTIEKYGGGSVRCMMAEIFPAK